MKLSTKSRRVFLVAALGVATVFSGTQALAAGTESLPEERRGAVIGGILGASVGGPFGATAGAIIGGAVIGKAVGINRVNKALNDEVMTLAQENEATRSEFNTKIAQLNRSLSKARAAEAVAKAAPEVPIQFKTGSSEIEAHYVDQLEEIATAVARNPIARIRLSGFADQRGDEAYNQALSEARVSQVKAFLTDHGVASSRIETRAFGESRPVSKVVGDADVVNAETLFFDRRVVMQFSTLDDTAPLAAR